MNASLPALSPDCKAGHLFLASGERSYAYQDLQCFGEFFIRFLKENKAINSKQPIGFCANSCDELIFAIAACWQLGIHFVPFDPDAPSPKMETQIELVNPGIIITDSPEAGKFKNVLTANIKQLKYPKVFGEKESAQPGSGIQVSRHHSAKVFGYLFTSGTTGKPKIVSLKRRQMHTAARASAKNLKPARNECWLLCLPLHHIGGTSVILRSLIYGSAIYRTESYDRDMVAELLSKNEKITVASLVPTMLERLLDDPDFTTHEKFKAILLGGGPVSSPLLKECTNRKIPVISSYGMTETCAQIAANPLMSEQSSDFSSIGKIFDSNKIEIRNHENKVVKSGQSGAIWLKGPQVFDGYFGSGAQNNFDENGWFNTGDFGRMDEEGNLFIEARRSDLIITGGENVSPIEIETALLELDSIKEAAVFGREDPEWGQKVVAAIVFGKGKHRSLQMIREALKEKLEGFKIPKEIFVTKKLPRTETGKIRRSELPSHYKM